MISKMHNKKGFIALIADLLLATGSIAFALATASAATTYADSVLQRELRIQAGLNANACLDSLELMYAKDLFLNGSIAILEFGCQALVNNSGSGGIIQFNVLTTLNGVHAYGNRTIHI